MENNAVSQYNNTKYLSTIITFVNKLIYSLLDDGMKYGRKPTIWSNNW
jgi:hypothetical protein